MKIEGAFPSKGEVEAFVVGISGAGVVERTLQYENKIRTRKIETETEREFEFPLVAEEVSSATEDGGTETFVARIVDSDAITFGAYEEAGQIVYKGKKKNKARNARRPKKVSAECDLPANFVGVVVLAARVAGGDVQIVESIEIGAPA